MNPVNKLIIRKPIASLHVERKMIVAEKTKRLEHFT